MEVIRSNCIYNNTVKNLIEDSKHWRWGSFPCHFPMRCLFIGHARNAKSESPNQDCWKEFGPSAASFVWTENAFRMVDCCQVDLRTFGREKIEGTASCIVEFARGNNLDVAVVRKLHTSFVPPIPLSGSITPIAIFPSTGHNPLSFPRSFIL
jgi:hypothetical protein